MGQPSLIISDNLGDFRHSYLAGPSVTRMRLRSLFLPVVALHSVYNSYVKTLRIVIVGGGPGGTACALALERLADQIGSRVQVTLLEGKQFTGERHYNQCVGVLSPPLPSLLEDQLCIPFPHHLIRNEISGYVLHTAREEITLEEEHEGASLSFRRVQFDAYMLEQVKMRGTAVLPARAVDLEFHDDQVVVYTENVPIETDVVVGAFGLDEGSAAMFSRTTAYRPPRALASIVTKYHPGHAGMVEFGTLVHAFLPAHPRIEFGAVTPKGNHLTINIAGDAVDVSLMRTFLDLPSVREVLPNLAEAGVYDPNDLRFFKGRFPRSLARGHYGDRYVIVGDAAGLVRAFKGKGVTSAVMTGIRAAATILKAGISESAFYQHYRLANQDIIADLPYGHGMRLVAIFLSRYGLLDPVIRAAHQNPTLRSALLDAVSARAPYSQVVKKSLQPKIGLSILRNFTS
jgi:flavin-dependent dehydrogenase